MICFVTVKSIDASDKRLHAELELLFTLG